MTTTARDHAIPPATAGSGVLGATGLSRTALAAMYRGNGLFGRDSDLDRGAQAAVLAMLPASHGGRPAAPAQGDPRRLALQDLVRAGIAGDAAAARAHAAGAGLAPAALAELSRLLANLREVFGPYPLAAVASLQPGLRRAA